MGDTNQPADPTEGIDEGSATGSTRRAYGFDWRHFTDWCEQADLSPLPPDPASIARYLTFCAEPIAGGSGGASVATVERRISGLIWNFAQRGATLSRQSAPIARALAHIRTTSNRPRDLKVPITGQDIIQMAGSLDRDLRGMRDRAILLLGLYGGLGRAEIVGLDIGSGDTEDGSGCIQWLDEKLILHVLGRHGHQRRVPIFSESSDHSCPVTALRTWLDFARIKRGAVFRRISQDGSHVRKRPVKTTPPQ